MKRSRLVALETTEPLDGLEPDELVARVRAALATAGVCVVRGKANRAEFLALANRLGIVFREYSIHVDRRSPSYTRNPGAVPFHTDTPRANVIAWQCVLRSPPAQMTFLDARDAYARLSPTDRDHARFLYLRSSPDGLSGLRPFVVWKRGVPNFFWLDYALVVQAVRGRRERRALRSVRRLLSGRARTRKVRVSLEPGDIVFIDNNRFLHGRDALPRASKRQLYRLWINTDGWAKRRARSLRVRTPRPLRTLRAQEPRFVR